MTYPETIDFLYGIRLFGQKLELGTMRQLLVLLGNPQQRLHFVHVAGTNGKGSVAAMLQAILTAAGYKTGLYTSPHLVSFCERFQIDGHCITEADVVRLVEQIRPALAAVGNHPDFRLPTFFETVTAMALLHFQENNVQVAVWETGLGGRLDATNVVTPLVSVITNVAMDHSQYLGTTLTAIAGEKAGIIKPRVPVVTAAANPEVMAVLQERCHQVAAPLIQVGTTLAGQTIHEDLTGQSVTVTGTRDHDGTFRIPLLGAHQATNVATAIAAVEASGLSVTRQMVADGLARTHWPGRFQVVPSEPLVILDGAHNPAAAEVLAQTLRRHFAHKRLALVLGVLRDKDYHEICRLLAPLAQWVACVTVNNERTTDPRELARCCAVANPGADVSVHRDVTGAYAATRRLAPDAIVITGSLFLVGEAMNRLALPIGVSPVGSRELVLQ